MRFEGFKRRSEEEERGKVKVKVKMWEVGC